MIPIKTGSVYDMGQIFRSCFVDKIEEENIDSETESMTNFAIDNFMHILEDNLDIYKRDTSKASELLFFTYPL